MNDPEMVVVDRPDTHQYELQRDGHVVSHATYQLSDDIITIPHVETDPQLRGRGYADQLMAGIADQARGRGLMIRPVCPFAAQFMRNNPATHDLIAS